MPAVSHGLTEESFKQALSRRLAGAAEKSTILCVYSTATRPEDKVTDPALTAYVPRMGAWTQEQGPLLDGVTWSRKMVAHSDTEVDLGNRQRSIL
ncbi:hypothetical protein NDU88_004793 [Pleurodeles waltl]|uniref:Uncharacterized protein n=1 Tax=Pleurodeles waltl TaxID=8319 RepID=A0AAV7RLI5_PLEWA|nr:hypothetical protein NDU88_004793 [Pleurodeles waltl]